MSNITGIYNSDALRTALSGIAFNSDALKSAFNGIALDSDALRTALSGINMLSEKDSKPLKDNFESSDNNEAKKDDESHETRSDTPGE